MSDRPCDIDLLNYSVSNCYYVRAFGGEHMEITTQV